CRCSFCFVSLLFVILLFLFFFFLFFLCFYCYFDHLDLHSFPTRRSSDLVDVWIEHRIGAVFGDLLYPAVQITDDAFRAENFFARSEEHTSELQSRVDLVCRLLLEKKKKKKQK